jgi:uncharacterized protein (DUF58 family)
MLSPELHKKIRHLEIVSRHLVQEALAGDYLSAFHGMGLEFEEVREYQPGDDVRAIDWNVTARQGRPFIKVFREERERTLLFCVDISGSQAWGSQGSTKRELAAQLMAALGLAAAAGGDKVGFLLFGGAVELALPPRKGRARVMRALREVLTLDVKTPGTRFMPAARQLPRLARRGSVVVWISDMNAPDVMPAFRAASHRFDLVACRLKDPLEQRLPLGDGLLPVQDPESGKRGWLDLASPFTRKDWAAKAEAFGKDWKGAMRQLRVDHVELECGGDILGPLLKLFASRSRRGRA